VSKKITGADKVWTIRDYPKDNEHRTIRIGDQLCQDVREYMMATGKRGEELLFSSSTGSPVSRNVFRTRVWLPAIKRSGLRQRVRFHDLRGAHASWLLAGGADLKAVMDRLATSRSRPPSSTSAGFPTPTTARWRPSRRSATAARSPKWGWHNRTVFGTVVPGGIRAGELPPDRARDRAGPVRLRHHA
jgi:Phage integrase family